MALKSLLHLLALTILFNAVPARAEVPAGAVWIDVRSPAEYASGHLETAQSIPFDGIEAGVAGLKLSKETPIYLYCAVGGRAEIAKKTLDAQGYSHVINVGGLEDARRVAAGKSP
jgi:phage shock protein E